MRRQAAFFFGSGISIPSGLPSVYEITYAARDEEWHLHSDGRFYPGPNPNAAIPDAVTPVVKAFLGTLTNCAADYRAELARPGAGLRPHYEDLFSLAEQASRADTDHVPNLATVDFLRRLRKETASLHCGFSCACLGAEGFSGLAEAACEFLHWVVHHKLNASGEKRRGLELISETAAAVDALDVFTTNHDTLVEAQLEADGISDVEMGFSDLSHGQFRVYRSRWWQSPKQSRQKVRMFKLHGSLNWWLYEFPGWARQYAIPLAGIDHSKDEKGNILRPIGWKAAFLTGTIVKELRYGLGFWGEQLEALKTHLATHTHLICCGYGFGDRGINQRLVQWMSDRLDGRNRLVILTSDPADSYFADKPYWLFEMRQHGRVTMIPQYLETCRIVDLEPFFDPLP